jgi:hypothetical protein
MLDTGNPTKQIPDATFKDIAPFALRSFTRSLPCPQRQIPQDGSGQTSIAVSSALLHAPRTWCYAMLKSIAFKSFRQCPLVLTSPWAIPLASDVSKALTSLPLHGQIVSTSLPVVSSSRFDALLMKLKHVDGSLLSDTHAEVRIRDSCQTRSTHIHDGLCATHHSEHMYIDRTHGLHTIRPSVALEGADGEPGLPQYPLISLPAAAACISSILQHHSWQFSPHPAQPRKLFASALLRTVSHVIHVTWHALRIDQKRRDPTTNRSPKCQPPQPLSEGTVGIPNANIHPENYFIQSAKGISRPPDLAKAMNGPRESQPIMSLPKKNPDKCSPETNELVGDISTQLLILSLARGVQPVVNTNIYERIYDARLYVSDAATLSVAFPLLSQYVTHLLVIVLLAILYSCFCFPSCKTLSSFGILWAITPHSAGAPPPPPRPEPLPYPTGPYQYSIASARAPAPPPRPEPQPYPTGPYQYNVATVLASR